MKKKFTPTPLADEYLESINGMQAAETDPFFYTRLKSRMDRDVTDEAWSFPLKPAWIISLLAFFLFINSFFLLAQVKQSKAGTSQETSIERFANGYDLSVSTSF